MYQFLSSEKKALEIRSMKKSDVEVIMHCFECGEKQKYEVRKRFRKLLSDWVEGESDFYYFTIWKGDNVIGCIITQAVEAGKRDAVVIIKILKTYQRIRKKVEKTLIEMCKSYWLYENLYFIPEGEKVRFKNMPYIDGYVVFLPSRANLKKLKEYKIIFSEEELG